MAVAEESWRKNSQPNERKYGDVVLRRNINIMKGSAERGGSEIWIRESSWLKYKLIR